MVDVSIFKVKKDIISFTFHYNILKIKVRFYRPESENYKIFNERLEHYIIASLKRQAQSLYDIKHMCCGCENDYAEIKFIFSLR